MIQNDQNDPHYDLDELKALIEQPKTRHITSEAVQTASEVGFASVSDIVGAVLELELEDFYKTMSSEKQPGTFQDVYHKTIKGIELYIKLRKSRDKGIVISFKKK
jgi:motility quorum-sensing regulator / GCU-specific mRNA interferase toxin